MEAVKTTVASLFGGDRGLLAMDESTSTGDRRFARLGIPQSVEARRPWRELIAITPTLGDAIGGAFLFDESIRQSTAEGITFKAVLEDAGIIPDIKVDLGALGTRPVIPARR